MKVIGFFLLMLSCLITSWNVSLSPLDVIMSHCEHLKTHTWAKPRISHSRIKNQNSKMERIPHEHSGVWWLNKEPWSLQTQQLPLLSVRSKERCAERLIPLSQPGQQQQKAASSTDFMHLENSIISVCIVNIKCSGSLIHSLEPNIHDLQCHDRALCSKH